MMMRVPVVLLLLGCWIIALPAVAAPAAPDPGPATGTVYFFFNGIDLGPGMWLVVPSVSIFVDGKIVAKLRQREYVGVRVPPGRRTFATETFGTKRKDTTIEFDMAAGEQAFLRVDMWIARFGLVKWAAYLRLVESREGVLMVSTLRPVEAKNIRDTVRATTQHPDPSAPASSTGSSEVSGASWMIPDEQGVYLVREQTLQRLTVELAASIKRAAGSTATLKQPRSRTRVELPAEFVIRAGEGTTAAEFVLLQLFMREDRREFRNIEPGAVNVQGPERVAIPFEARRIAPNVFHLRIVAAPRGEYGFVRPGAALTQSVTSDAVTFTFGVDGFVVATR
jgi:hypothetical protein